VLQQYLKEERSGQCLVNHDHQLKTLLNIKNIYLNVLLNVINGSENPALAEQQIELAHNCELT
jgi:hypothetical protein